MVDFYSFKFSISGCCFADFKNIFYSSFLNEAWDISRFSGYFLLIFFGWEWKVEIFKENTYKSICYREAILITQCKLFLSELEFVDRHFARRTIPNFIFANLASTWQKISRVLLNFAVCQTWKKYAISVWPPYGFRIISVWFPYGKSMRTVWEEYGDSISLVWERYGNCIAAAYLRHIWSIRIVSNQYATLCARCLRCARGVKSFWKDRLPYRRT